MYLVSEEELATRGISPLPNNLGAALDAFEADSLALEVFGPAMHKSFLEVKRAEWDAYCAHVSDWELERYLEFF
jgi:glutamine synthetase